MEKISELHQNWDSVKFGFVEGVTSLYRNWFSDCAEIRGSFFSLLPLMNALSPLYSVVR